MCHHTYYSRACGCSTILEEPARVAHCDAYHAGTHNLCSITTEIITAPAEQASWLCRSCSGSKYDQRLRSWEVGTLSYDQKGRQEMPRPSTTPRPSAYESFAPPKLSARWRDSMTDGLPISPIQATENKNSGFWRQAFCGLLRR